MCLVSCLLILTGKEFFLSEQCVYQIQSQKDSFLCELCEGKQAEGILLGTEFQFALGVG